MHGHTEAHPHGGGRTELDVGAIVRRFGDAFVERHPVGHRARRALIAIGRCRTAALGGHRYVCSHCTRAVSAYNSCRDRHCPKCEGARQHRWIEARRARLVRSSYFHVVFTLPAELRPIARANPSEIYALLFRSAAATLIELGRDPRRLGGLVGVTAILHTWSRTLAFHPHVHCVVTAGGLSDDDERWRRSRRRYLFGVRVMGALFRGKMLAGLRRLLAAGRLQLGGASASLTETIGALYGKSWVVYAKKPFGGAEAVFRYLGQYTHRVGLANSRLRAVSDGGITFTTRGGGTVTLHPFEFLRRFCQHVLPVGFVKIRHYGLMASVHAKTKLATAQRLLGGPPETDVAEADEPSSEDTVELADLGSMLVALRVGGRVRCPWCSRGHLRLEQGGPDPP